MKTLTTSFLIMISVTIYAQIENVEFEIQNDTIVVNYDILSKETYYAELYYSKDNGINWHGPLKNIKGDIYKITAGRNKNISFNFLEENPWLIVEHLRFKIKLIQAIGTFTDPRDGQNYTWVKIGEQIWMAEDLRATRYTDGTPILIEHKDKWDELTISDKACRSEYENIVVNSPERGLLYTWAAASNGKVSNTNPSGVQGVCPARWHLPSWNEWKQLSKFNQHFKREILNKLQKKLKGKHSPFEAYWGTGSWWDSTPGGYNTISYLYNLKGWRTDEVKSFPVRCIKN